MARNNNPFVSPIKIPKGGLLGITEHNQKRKRTLTSADKKRIAAKQGWKCKKCKIRLPARYHIDHIKEFSKGGSDREDNLQALCPNCHGDKTEDERYRNKRRRKRSRQTDMFGLPKFSKQNPLGI